MIFPRFESTAYRPEDARIGLREFPERHIRVTPGILHGVPALNVVTDTDFVEKIPDLSDIIQTVFLPPSLLRPEQQALYPQLDSIVDGGRSQTIPSLKFVIPSYMLGANEAYEQEVMVRVKGAGGITEIPTEGATILSKRLTMFNNEDLRPIGGLGWYTGKYHAQLTRDFLAMGLQVKITPVIAVSFLPYFTEERIRELTQNHHLPETYGYEPYANPNHPSYPQQEAVREIYKGLTPDDFRLVEEISLTPSDISAYMLSRPGTTGHTRRLFEILGITNSNLSEVLGIYRTDGLRIIESFLKTIQPVQERRDLKQAVILGDVVHALNEWSEDTLIKYGLGTYYLKDFFAARSGLYWKDFDGIHGITPHSYVFPSKDISRHVKFISGLLMRELLQLTVNMQTSLSPDEPRKVQREELHALISAFNQSDYLKFNFSETNGQPKVTVQYRTDPSGAWNRTALNITHFLELKEE